MSLEGALDTVCEEVNLAPVRPMSPALRPDGGLEPGQPGHLCVELRYAAPWLRDNPKMQELPKEFESRHYRDDLLMKRLNRQALGRDFEAQSLANLCWAEATMRFKDDVLMHHLSHEEGCQGASGSLR